jgi:hypothetical protein
MNEYFDNDNDGIEIIEFKNKNEVNKDEINIGNEFENMSNERNILFNLFLLELWNLKNDIKKDSIEFMKGIIYEKDTIIKKSRK